MVKRHLGGRGVLECVCRVSYRILSYGKGGTPKLGVGVEGVYRTIKGFGGYAVCSPDFVHLTLSGSGFFVNFGTITKIKCIVSNIY